MCQLPICFWLPFWWPVYLAGLATVTVSRLNRAVPPLQCKTPSSSLIRLHVRTLRLNPNAGRPQPFVMRGGRPRLVPPSCEGS